MKKTIITLLTLTSFFAMSSQDIDIKKDFITINKTQIAKLEYSKPKRDSIFVYDLEGKLKFTVRTRWFENDRVNGWKQVFNGDYSKFVDIIPNKSRPFKPFLEVAEMFYDNKLYTEKGFDEEAIKSFFENQSKEKSIKLDAEIAKAAQIAKTMDSLDKLMNTVENMNMIKSQYQISINGDRIINKKNNEHIGNITKVNEEIKDFMGRIESVKRQYLLSDLDNNLMMIGDFSGSNFMGLMANGHKFYLPKTENPEEMTYFALVRGAKFGNVLKDSMMKSFYCGLNLKEKHQAMILKSMNDSIEGKITFEDYFQKSKGGSVMNISKISGDRVFTRYYINESGAEKQEKFSHNNFVMFTIKETGCKYVSVEAPRTDDRTQSIGGLSFNTTSADKLLCKEIYKNKSLSIMECPGSLGIFYFESKEIYRSNNEKEIKSLINYLAKKNPDISQPKSFNSFDLIEWAKQLEK